MAPSTGSLAAPTRRSREFLRMCPHASVVRDDGLAWYKREREIENNIAKQEAIWEVG